MKTQTLNKVFLLFSSSILIVIALSFGANPENWTSLIYDVNVSDVNSQHIYRSVMGLIFGLVGFWIFAAFNSKYTLAGLYSLLFSMLGLVFGRISSLLLDGGTPNAILLVFLVMEAGTALVTYFIINKNNNLLKK